MIFPQFINFIRDSASEAGLLPSERLCYNLYCAAEIFEAEGQNDTFCEYAAMMYSFFGACKVKGRNEERWLTYVLDHIKNTKEEDLYKLLPEFWEDIN